MRLERLVVADLWTVCQHRLAVLMLTSDDPRRASDRLIATNCGGATSGGDVEGWQGSFVVH